MARKQTKAQTARQAERAAENARHEARRAAMRAKILNDDNDYGQHKRQQEESERKRREAEEIQRVEYEAKMIELTGLRSGIGVYTCQKGHRHATTNDCTHKRNQSELEDSTTRLPHGYVAGQKVPISTLNIDFAATVDGL